MGRWRRSVHCGKRALSVWRHGIYNRCSANSGKTSLAAETYSLVASTQRGHSRATGATTLPTIDWQAALAEHDRWLRTVVLARLREGQAVDEVMQEVALAAVRQAAPLADAAKVAPWLYRLAVTQALLFRRRCGRQRRLVDRYGEQADRNGDCTARVIDPLGWLLAEERREQVRAALARLPRRDAEILLLKYTEHWNYRQIAARLGVSHSAVEARLHRARRRLREELAALDVIEVTR